MGKSFHFVGFRFVTIKMCPLQLILARPVKMVRFRKRRLKKTPELLLQKGTIPSEHEECGGDNF
jgi:hypothetical protein